MTFLLGAADMRHGAYQGHDADLGYGADLHHGAGRSPGQEGDSGRAD